ncbi:MAG: hypothetical protein CMM16_04940 [Rhodospirillaceae bacterium]|nr:hypothetical protein [Rhodospirillaceae bacterium]
MWVTVNSDFDRGIPDKLIESRSSRWLVTKWLKKRIDFVMFFKDGYFARQKSSKIAFNLRCSAP